MRAAVRGWSPVIMITRMPARRASRIATAASSRGGSMMPTVPTKIRSRSSDASARRILARRERPVGDGQRAQRGIRQPVHIGQDPRAPRRRPARRHPCRRAPACSGRAARPGAPLVMTHQRVAVLVIQLDRRHHLALGGERDLAHPLEAPLAPLGHAELALRDQERRLRRDRPGSPTRPPRVCRRSALPARLPPLSTTIVSRQRPRSSSPCSCSTRPSGA